LYYYKKLSDILQHDVRGATDAFIKELLIITNGNIGENLALQKEYDLAMHCAKSPL